MTAVDDLEISGIARELVHVDELDIAGALAKRSLEQAGALRADGDEHRLVRVEPLCDERQRPLQKAVVALVEQRLVPERILHESHLYSSRGGRIPRSRFDRCEFHVGRAVL